MLVLLFLLEIFLLFVFKPIRIRSQLFYAWYLWYFTYSYISTS